MPGLPSIFDLRRATPLHYWSRADNARFAAFLLSRAADDSTMREAADASGYRGTPSIATHEAYRREAALALELIIKAVIAQRIESRRARKDVVRVRPVHDVPTLWNEAGLPKLANEDQRRLLLAKQILTWSGRYAAPKDDEQFERERAEDNALKQPSTTPGIRFEKPLSFNWEDFDRLYQIALRERAALSRR